MYVITMGFTYYMFEIHCIVLSLLQFFIMACTFILVNIDQDQMNCDL